MTPLANSVTPNSSTSTIFHSSGSSLVTFHSSTSNFSPPSASPLSSSSNDPNLTEKIAIPIGTTIGVASFVGITYYLAKKRNKKTQQLGNGSREQMINQTEREANEIIELTNFQSEEDAQEVINPQQAQIEQLPK